MGGLARRAAFIKENAPVADEAALLLVDGGDTLWGETPSLLMEESQGRVMVDAMNMMGYHALALGESDLTMGEETLRQRMADARFPLLSANVALASTGELLAPGYALLELGGRRLAVIGLTGTGGPQASGLFDIRDPAAAVPPVVQEASQQAELIVLLSNLSWEANKSLADTVPGIDVIIGLGTRAVPTQAWRSLRHGTLVCQPTLFGQDHPGVVATVAEVRVDGSGRVSNYAVRSVELETDYPEDEDMLRWLSEYR